VLLAQWWLGSGVVRRDGIKKQKRKGAHDNKKQIEIVKLIKQGSH